MALTAEAKAELRGLRQILRLLDVFESQNAYPDVVNRVVALHEAGQHKAARDTAITAREAWLDLRSTR